MPEVTCPACHTRQPIDAAAPGYVCQSCGTDWEFVSCVSCGARFHAGPSADAWTCPACGTENAGAHTAGDAGGPSAGISRMMLLGIGGLVIVALVAVLLSRGDGDPAPSPSTSTSPSATSGTAALCAHLVDIQSLRFDALGRVASTLREDAEAIRAEGEVQLAGDVNALAAAVRTLRDALGTEGNEDDQAATEAMLTALEPIPC